PLKSEITNVTRILLSVLSIVERCTNQQIIVGSFDLFAFPQFPTTYGRFFVTDLIANLAGTVSQLELTLRVEEKGSAHVMFSTSTKLNFPSPQTFDQTTVMALAVPVMGVVFQRPRVIYYCPSSRWRGSWSA